MSRIATEKGIAMPRKFVLELEFPEDVSEKDLEDAEIKKKSKEAVVLELLRKKITSGKIRNSWNNKRGAF